MGVENIKKYLQTAYSDEQLSALLAHAQDGKLCYISCCCLVGFPTADHSYQGHTEDWGGDSHFSRTLKDNLLACKANSEYSDLCMPRFDKNPFSWEATRRKRIIPIILEEIARRDALKAGTMEDTTEEPTVEELWDDGKTMLELTRSIGTEFLNK